MGSLFPLQQEKPVRSGSQRMIVRGLMLALLTSASTAAFAQTAGADEDHTYTISQEDSQLFVQVFYDRDKIASGFAHDHAIRAGKLGGEVHFDPNAPSECRLALTVPAKALIVDEPALRKQVGYEGPLDKDDRKKVRENMLAKGQLNARKYPNIEFRADDCRRVEGKRDLYTVQLTVEVRGKEKTRPVKVRIRTRNGELTARSAFNLKHSDFGMEPYSALMGAVGNAQPIRFEARLHANLE